MLALGDKVRVRPPFSEGFPGAFNIVRINPDGVCGIDAPGYEDPDYPGADFSPEFLEKVEAV